MRNLGKLNLIEPEEVATAAILTNHLPEWGYEITKPIAAALLTGIITDTLGFRTSNTNPSALRLCAMLMETGVDMPDLYMHSLVNKSFPAARYWGAGLSRWNKRMELYGQHSHWKTAKNQATAATMMQI